MAWLIDDALPLWTRAGVDRRAGGFHEKLDRSGLPVDEPRRTRVVARQIYVFATAARRGWLPDGDALVEHGLDFLLRRLRQPDGTYAAKVRPDGTVVDGTFDLYEHAFVLFALAEACRERPARESRLRLEAESLLRTLRLRWSHPVAGFEEAVPRRLPLRSNPHMHLLEAALAWTALSTESTATVWNDLVDELVHLCLDRFIDPRSGGLYELFDGDWRPMDDATGRIVEPGHQFEWAWLLLRCARRRRGADARSAALRLLEIGEGHGVDRHRDLAIDALDDGFRVRETTARLWPQTERIKAWHAAWQDSDDDDRADHADRMIGRAADGLATYLRGMPAGLWHERIAADGTFIPQHTRASSLYHIVCAVDVLSGAACHPPRRSSP